MKDFQTLKVWQKAHILTLEIYQKTRFFPKEEIYGLTSQIRRASSSIGANLAEGCGRNTDKELARYVQIAQGSAYEVEYHLLLAKDLNYLDQQVYEQFTASILEIQRMLRSFREKLVASC
jgi:four helix bundle protein